MGRNYVSLMRFRFKKRKRRIYDYLVKTNGERCATCGREDKLTIDHMQSLVAGGDNDFSNFQLLCDPCHRRKDKTEKIGRGKVYRKRNRRAALGHWQQMSSKEWKRARGSDPAG